MTRDKRTYGRGKKFTRTCVVIVVLRGCSFLDLSEKIAREELNIASRFDRSSSSDREKEKERKKARKRERKRKKDDVVAYIFVNAVVPNFCQRMPAAMRS